MQQARILGPLARPGTETPANEWQLATCSGGVSACDGKALPLPTRPGAARVCASLVSALPSACLTQFRLPAWGGEPPPPSPALRCRCPHRCCAAHMPPAIAAVPLARFFPHRFPLPEHRVARGISLHTTSALGSIAASQTLSPRASMHGRFQGTLESFSLSPFMRRAGDLVDARSQNPPLCLFVLH